MNRNSKDFFQSIGEFPHNIGIYLTYTLDTEVIDKLTEFAAGTKLILHDYTQGKIIDDNDNSTIVCLPTKTLNSNDKNCFHSKLALLKAENSAKLILGSANLSIDSFVTEKEIAFEMELKFENSSDIFIYNKVLVFIENLKHQLLVSNGILEQTIDKMRFKELPEIESEIQFVYNSKEKSIFNEFKSYLAKHRSNQNVKSLKIATPFVSDDYKNINEIKRITNNISVYLRKGAKINSFKQNKFNIFQPVHKKRDGFHAKLILVEYDSDAVLYIGSANFTEQGFFKTLNESANQECGIILKINEEEMNEWFNVNLWKQLSESELENYVEEKDNYLELFETQNNHYAWAEKENARIVTYIFNPNKLPVSKTKESNKINLIQVNPAFLYKTTEFEAQNQKVTFYIGEEKCTIPVFELNEYISGLNEKGESIFNSFKGLYSINPSELDNAIEKEKISVSENTSIKISEPPKLEQYFYNVKYLILSLKNKKYFSDFNEKEIQLEINKDSDGRTLYLALQLLKIFNNKANTENISLICQERIEKLSEKLNIDNKLLNTFIAGWLTSKI
jgi:hypothetical protein